MKSSMALKRLCCFLCRKSAPILLKEFRWSYFVNQKPRASDRTVYGAMVETAVWQSAV